MSKPIEKEKTKSLLCNCGNEVITPNDDKIVGVKCWKCVCKITLPEETEEKKVNVDKKYKKPKDWIYLDNFVDIYGNIYCLGKKIGDGGTPTNIKGIRKTIQKAKEQQMIKLGKKINKLKKEK